MANKLQDPVFGELTWDDKYRWWTGKVQLNPDLSFKLYLHEYPKDASEDIAPYHRYFEFLCQNEAAAREYAAQELLGVYNDHWRGDGPILTKEEFCRKMEPDSIGFYESDNADFYYLSKELFGEHTIVVAVESGVFVYADFEG